MTGRERIEIASGAIADAGAEAAALTAGVATGTPRGRRRCPQFALADRRFPDTTSNYHIL